MEQISTVSTLISVWPSRRQFAEQVGAPVARVHKWARVGAIPAKYHLSVVQAGSRLDPRITADLLVRLHAQEDAA